MDGYVIQGGASLKGRVKVHGAKNSILPILAASLLNSSSEPIRLVKAPKLLDVQGMLEILKKLGATITLEGDDILLRTDQVDCYHVPDYLMQEMRSSTFLIGPLLGRLGKAKMSYPGGCAIGSRPIDLHLHGLQTLGAIIEEKGGYVNARGILKGAEVFLSYPSVGATENLMMAGVLARGKTVIRNAAREPEIVDLQNFLNMLGAQIRGAGSEVITVTGVPEVGGGRFRVFHDRIVAGTYMLAAVVTRGAVTVEDVLPGHQAALIRLLEEAGIEVETGDSWITVRGGPFRALSQVEIEPYPGFPTDLQPQLVAMLALARGSSVVVENVFSKRFRHVAELNKMGARITLKDNRAEIQGVRHLKGAVVEATDLRAGAALVLAGLAPRGNTVIYGQKFIERGYENLHGILNSLGAQVEPISRSASD